MISILTRAISKLDIIAAILGIVVLPIAIAIILVKHLPAIYLVAVLVGLFCVLVYILFRNKLSLNIACSGKCFSIYFTGLFVSVLWALFLFITRENQYEKPLIYYILMAIGAILFFLSALESKSKLHVYLLLSFAVIMGLSHIWTENMMFTGLIGLDPNTHLRTATQDLALAGTYGYPPLTIKTMGGGYSLMHVWLRWIMSFGVDYKMAALIFWGSLQAIGTIIFIYLIGKELLNKTVGLVAALMVASANWVVFFGEWVIPNSIGAMLSLIVAFMFIKSYKSKKLWVAWLSLLVFIVAILTHILVAVWVVGTIICLTAVTLVLDLLKGRNYAISFNK